jgi:hypothetical protein
MASRHRADFTAGSLKVAESRIVADLLLKQVDDAGWRESIVSHNVLRARNASTATVLARLIRQRLETMSAPLWGMVRDGNNIVATHACLAAAIKRSALLADFLELVVKERYRVFAEKLTNGDWDGFIEDCQCRAPDLPKWSESTVKRLRSSAFQILEQAGYIESTRTLKLQTVHIADEVLSYLKKYKENGVLRCIEIAP